MLIGSAVSDDSQTKEITGAITRFAERDIDGCRAILERARGNNPKLPPPGVMMAMLWRSVNQLAPARAELEDTAVKFPGDPEPYLMLGDLAMAERRITDSAVLFEKGTELTKSFNENPKRKRNFDIRCNAGNCAVCVERKQWDKAQQYLATWIELDPDNAFARFRLGEVLFRLGKESEALAAFQEARKIDPKTQQLPELNMAVLSNRDGDKDATKKWIAAAIKAAPKDPAVLLQSAEWYIGQNDLDAAKKIAEDALQIDPKSLGARLTRGSIARVARDYATAEKFLNEAHVQSPGNFGASNSLALVLIEMDDKEKRQRAVEMAEANAAMHRENSPQQVNALTTLAWVYYKMGRREDAEKILDQIARNNALTQDGAFYVAKLLSDRGEKDRARKILEEVLAKDVMFATRNDATELLATLKN